MSWTAALSTDPSSREESGRRPLASRASVAIGILLLATLTGHGAPSDSGSGKLASALDGEIEALTKELTSITSEEQTTSGDLDALATREALSRRRYEEAALRRDEVIRGVAAGERQCVALGRQLETSRARARAALKESYKQGDVPEYASLLSVEGPSDLLRAVQSLDVLARRQSDAVTDYRQRLKDSEEATLGLRVEKALLDRAVMDASQEEARLQIDRSARLELLDRLKKDRSLQKQALDEMTRAMGALNEAIRQLPPDSPAPRLSISFSRLEGALPWPVQGSIFVPFGAVRNPRFGTLTPHPGIDIRVDPATPVRSVGAGRVVFNRRYGSYGRTVVIDHGERYLSVYARLAAAPVSEGDEVAPGQEVGFAGEADEYQKSSIYFEIRHQGRALDPVGWLRKPRSRLDSGGTH
jgi:septal ring factor EnvC (AmiA/AmiB activator)